MTPAEVAAKLQYHNDWRRGHHDEQPDPCEISEAIDAAVEMIDRLEAAEKAVTEAYQRGYETGQEEIEMIDRLDAKGQDQARQDALMKFDPSTGEEKPYPSHAAQWRNWHGTAAWLFDPWTGKQRNAYDVGSDVYGLLIAPAGTLGMDMGGGCATTTKGVMKRARGESK